MPILSGLNKANNKQPGNDHNSRFVAAQTGDGWTNSHKTCPRDLVLRVAAVHGSTHSTTTQPRVSQDFEVLQTRLG